MKFLIIIISILICINKKIVILSLSYYKIEIKSYFLIFFGNNKERRNE